MPDEIGTEATCSDASGVDNSLFGEASDTPATSADEQDTKGEPTQGPKGIGAPDKAAEKPEGSDAPGKTAEESEELKVVVSIKGGRATIGVQQPSSDPHIETFDGPDLPSLTREVPAVFERARAGWQESLKHPAYERPAPPAKRRTRRQKGAAQGATTETQATDAEAQQQTPRLF